MRGEERESEGSKDLRRLYYKYKQGRRKPARRGEVGRKEDKRGKQANMLRRQEEKFTADDGKRGAERRGMVEQNQPQDNSGFVRRKKPIFVTQERRLKAPSLKAVMEERSYDSRLTDSRLTGSRIDSRLTDSRLDSRLKDSRLDSRLEDSRFDSRLTSNLDSKPKLTLTNSKADSQTNKITDSNPTLENSEQAKSQLPKRVNTNKRKSAGKENQLYNRIMGLTSKNFGQLQKVYNPPVNAYMGIPG